MCLLRMLQVDCWRTDRFQSRLACKEATIHATAVPSRILSDRRWESPETFQPRVLRTTGPFLFTMAVEEFLDDRRVGIERHLLP